MNLTRVRVMEINRHPTINTDSQAAVVLTGEVCAAISPRLTSIDEPPTRLFWV
jgi:hypothetical protein